MIICFKAITNTISITSQRLSQSLSAHQVYKEILRTRNIYKILIDAIEISKSRLVVLNKESSDEDIREAFSSILKTKDNDYNNKENNEDKEPDGLENKEVDAKRSLSKAIIPKTHKTKWDKFKTLLNVYIRLHIIDNV
jgi:hypothetical protein